MVGARIKIMWEEQLDDPPNEYITPVNLYGKFYPKKVIQIGGVKVLSSK